MKQDLEIKHYHHICGDDQRQFHSSMEFLHALDQARRASRIRIQETSIFFEKQEKSNQTVGIQIQRQLECKFSDRWNVLLWLQLLAVRPVIGGMQIQRTNVFCHNLASIRIGIASTCIGKQALTYWSARRRAAACTSKSGQKCKKCNLQNISEQ